VLAGAIVAFSPTEAAFGRGLESPYLATTFVAAGLVGLRRRDSAGAALAVGAFAAASGMHVGLVGLLAFAALKTVWEAGREREARGIRASQVRLLALAASLPFAAVVLRLDLARLLSDLVLLGNGAGEGYAAEIGPFSLQLAIFAITPWALGLVLLGVLVGRLPRFRGIRESDPTIPLLALAAGAAPFVVGWIGTGYLSADHSGALLPLLLASVACLARRSAPGAMAVWLVACLMLRGGAGPKEDDGPRAFELALETAEVIRLATPEDREPWTFVARDVEGRTPPAFSADVLGEIVRTARPPAPSERATCFLVVSERRVGPLGLPRVEAPGLRSALQVDLFHDLDCAAMRTRLPELCAAVPEGFYERSWPRRIAPEFTFAGLPGSCSAPMGMEP
jgi:hypothetical protein